MGLKEAPALTKGWEEKGFTKRDSERMPRKVGESQGRSLNLVAKAESDFRQMFQEEVSKGKKENENRCLFSPF